MGRDPKAYGWRVRTKSYAPRGVSLAARGMARDLCIDASLIKGKTK